MDRGVVLSELERFGVEEIDLDEPGPGEARGRIEATGVCHSDLHVVRTGFNHPLPVLLGHEGQAWSRCSARASSTCVRATVS